MNTDQDKEDRTHYVCPQSGCLSVSVLILKFFLVLSQVMVLHQPTWLICFQRMNENELSGSEDGVF